MSAPSRSDPNLAAPLRANFKDQWVTTGQVVQQFVHRMKMQKILPISYEPDFIHWVQLCRSDIDKCFHHGQTWSKLNQNAMTNLVRAMDPDALAPIASKRVSVSVHDP